MNNENQNICKDTVFESLYKKHAFDLKKFLSFKFNDFDTADDIMQDAFVKLWQKCADVPLDKAKSFLFTVANNLFLNVKKREQTAQRNAIHFSKSTTNESPEYILEEKEYLLKIDKAIASLTEKQREVFLMNKIEKKKYAEIAVALDISVKAVEKRMHKALIVMKDFIKRK
jgi:RNA polymerase sigma-70 factor (ECF subfamily)